MGNPVRLLIVEDHQLLAEGLGLALQRDANCHVVGLAHNVADATRLAEQERPDVILMDYYLPDATGAEAAVRIRRHLPNVAIVVLTARDDDDTLLAAVEAGASGFLLKTQAVAQVADAVRRAAEGEMLIPAARLAGLISRQRQHARHEAERTRVLSLLARREREVLQLMAQGLDNRAIAERLAISFTTARGYVQNVLEKLGAHSKLEAVARASQLGLLDP